MRARRESAIKRQARERERVDESERERDGKRDGERRDRKREEGQEGVRGVGSKRELKSVFFTV